MPTVTLEVVSLDGAPLPEPLRCRFEPPGGNLGRDAGNSLVLEDKHRRVSRLHAAITFPAGVPTLTNASTSLPVVVGERELDCGQTVALTQGMLFEIGPFMLRVLLEPAAVDLPVEASPAPASLAPPAPAVPWEAPAAMPLEVPAPVAPGMDPLADLLGGAAGAALVQGPTPGMDPPACAGPAAPVPAAPAAGVVPPNPGPSSALPSAVDPFAAFWPDAGGGSPPIGAPVAPELNDPFAALGFGAPPVAPAAVEAPSMPVPGAAGAAGRVLIPEDFNPFELPSQTQRNAADPMASLLPPATAPAGQSLQAPSIDTLFSGTAGGLGAGAEADHLGLLRPGSPGESDPLALFGQPSAVPMPGDPMRDNVPEIGAAFQPPRGIAFEPVAPAAVPVPPQPLPASALDVAALTAAFLQGARLPPQALPQGLTPETMALIGSLLRSATAGAVDMLSARAATKRELQASVTIISAKANNPLKFLNDPSAALQQMLHSRLPGFMRGDEAMRDAFEDLRAHEVGVIAGTRAALQEVLHKFSPELLDERLAKGSVLASLLPAMRKTRLWEQYLERYAEIRQEAEDDFQSIFGRAFLEAYEAETERIRAHIRTQGEGQ